MKRQVMGRDPASGYGCNSDELPLHTVSLDAYRIDKTEVTNAQYSLCVIAGSCTAPTNTSSSTRPSYFGNLTYASYPVIYVSWDQSAAYCAWAGKRLPTEAEWEKAARGPNDTRAFPWGNETPTCDLVNFFNHGSYCEGKTSDTSPVGSFPSGASPYGALDMAGNVLEYVNDWYQSDYYSVSPSINPPGPTTGNFKILRGGGVGSPSVFSMSVTNRSHGYFTPPLPSSGTGFRCAVSP
jgi:eukaryotic-like serine/threonine-protein kinase